MQTSLITPVSELHRTRDDKIHLVLSHLLTTPGYFEFYRDRHHQAYVILDNSAHEHGSGNGIENLWNQGKALFAHELVLPDALFDANRTASQSIEALRWIAQIERNLDLKSQYEWYPRRLMFVPQGKSFQEYVDCFYMFWEEWFLNPAIHSQLTIGVSKDYNDPEWGTSLHEILTWLIHESPIVDEFIHILGWPKPFGVLNDLNIEFGHWIRSTDSARACVFAAHGIPLENSHYDSSEYPGRPDNFFTEEIPNSELLDWNIEYYRTLASDGRTPNWDSSFPPLGEMVI